MKSPDLSLGEKSKRAKICVLLALIFLGLYLEPLVIFGLKFSHFYKILVVYILMLSIFIHRSYGLYDRGEKYYTVLIFIAYCWAAHPIIFSFTRDYIFDSLFIGGQRFFSVLLFHWILHKNFTVKTLFLFYELFLVFIILTAAPFIAGIAKPLGQAYDLSTISGGDSKAFIGVFQNSHGASTMLSMAASGAFSLGLTSDRQKTKNYFYIMTCVFLILTILTYTRSGWIAAIAGIVTVLWMANKNRPIFGNMKIWTVVLVILLVVFSIVFKYGETIKMRALGQTKHRLHSAQNLNEVSSGRLLIWKASARIYQKSSLLEKISGIGEKGLRERMYQHIGLAIFSHNGFINQLIVDGLIGLCFLLTLLIYIFHFFSALVSRKYKVLCISTLMCWLTHFFFQGGEFPVANALLFLLVAISLLAPNRLINRNVSN